MVVKYVRKFHGTANLTCWVGHKYKLAMFLWKPTRPFTRHILETAHCRFSCSKVFQFVIKVFNHMENFHFRYLRKKSYFWGSDWNAVWTWHGTSEKLSTELIVQIKFPETESFNSLWHTSRLSEHQSNKLFT